MSFHYLQLDAVHFALMVVSISGVTYEFLGLIILTIFDRLKS